MGAQAVTRSHHDLVARRIEADDVQRLGAGDLQAFALTDRVVDDAVVAAELAAVDMHDVAGLQRAGLQALDDAGVAARRHEADVLAVGLLGDGQIELARKLAHLRLRHAAEREPQASAAAPAWWQTGNSSGRGRHRRRAPSPGPLRAVAALDVVARRQHVGAELLGGVEKIAELDLLVARDARDRRLAGGVALGEGCR